MKAVKKYLLFTWVRIVAVIVAVSVSQFSSSIVFAQSSSGLPKFVYMNHTPENDMVLVGNNNSYRDFANYNTNFYSRDIVGMGLGNVQQIAQGIINENPGVPITFALTGHGGEGGYLDGLYFSGGDAIRMFDDLAGKTGADVNLIIDSCFAGDNCVNLSGIKNVNVFPSTYPGESWNQIQWFDNDPASAINAFPESIKKAIQTPGADANNDGVITAGEMNNALHGAGSSPSHIPDPDKPMYTKNAESLAKYDAEHHQDNGKKISVTTDYVWDQNPLHPKTSPASYYDTDTDNDAVA